MQLTIPSLLYQTRRKNPLVHKGLNTDKNLDIFTNLLYLKSILPPLEVSYFKSVITE